MIPAANSGIPKKEKETRQQMSNIVKFSDEDFKCARARRRDAPTMHSARSYLHSIIDHENMS